MTGFIYVFSEDLKCLVSMEHPEGSVYVNELFRTLSADVVDTCVRVVWKNTGDMCVEFGKYILFLAYRYLGT